MPNLKDLQMCFVVASDLYQLMTLKIPLRNLDLNLKHFPPLVTVSFNQTFHKWVEKPLDSDISYASQTL